MLGNCRLAEEINKCPYYIRGKDGCGADHTSCGFFRNPEARKETANQKEPKWFEQYYKR